MADNQQNTADLKSQVFVFNGHKHNLAQVMAQGNAGPQITVDEKDIDTGTCEEGLGRSSIDAAILASVDCGETIVYKKEGKFQILFGMNKVNKAFSENASQIKARLISSPALKKCRIQEPQFEVAAIAAAPTYPTRRDYTQDRRPTTWNR